MKVQIEITEKQIKDFADYIKQQAIVNNFTAGDFIISLDLAKAMLLGDNLKHKTITLEDIKEQLDYGNKAILKLIEDNIIEDKEDNL
jgi:hypothetical protein